MLYSITRLLGQLSEFGSCSHLSKLELLKTNIAADEKKSKIKGLYDYVTVTNNI